MRVLGRSRRSASSSVDLLVNRKVLESYRLADGTMLFGYPGMPIPGGESAESRP